MKHKFYLLLLLLAGGLFAGCSSDDDGVNKSIRLKNWNLCPKCFRVLLM